MSITANRYHSRCDNMKRLLPLTCVVVMTVLLVSVARSEPKKKRWLARSGYGLMFHYEAFENHSPKAYNAAIDSFDVVRFADAVAGTRAGYVIFVVGQHWGKYCAPNSAYEKLLGVGPGV